ncbi:sensor histidine kinase [Flavobacterium sp. GCM10027622]|uniref:sensor histidine kinase n=1 Tax=unclassified Flavobacterium TaxID=196869 RepID=UPI0036076B41
MKAKFFHILLFLFANQLFAQQPVTIQLTEKDGLPDIEFYDILEDKSGFIWLAADKGLYRYNGKSFVNFTHPEKRGLSVFGLFQDENGTIWCNNISGQFFYVKDGKLILFTDLKNELKGQLPEFIVKKNELIAFSEKGIFKINTQSKKKELIKDKFSNSPYYRNPFQYNNQLYFSLTNEIKTFNHNQIETQFTFTNKGIEPKNNAFCDLKGALLFTTFYDGKQHFFIKENQDKSFTSIEVPSQLIDKTFVRILKEDNLLWFCTNQGVVVCRQEGHKIIYKSTYLPNEYITKVIKDKNNNFWFSTLRNGVFIMPNIYIQKIQLPEIAKNVSTMTVIGNDNIAFGTPEGLLGIVNTKTYKSTTFQLENKSKIWQLVYNENFNSLFISQENQSYLWNLNESTIYKLAHFTASKTMVVAQNNSLLNASFDRANVMENPFTGNRNRTLFNTNLTPKISNSTITPTIKNIRKKRAYTCFYSLNNNTNYVGFVDDLIQFDSDFKPTVIRHKNQPIFAIGIAETNDGTIWVSTFKDGILGIKDKKVVYNLNAKKGLLSNETGKLKSDGDQLWISTQGGLQVFDVKTGSFLNITKNDGLESYSISDIEIIQNQVYLSSNKGIFTLDKTKSFKNLQKPEIYFTGVTIQDKNSAIQKNYSLSYNKNAIKISFNSNGFQSSESITYHYRLTGFANEWRPLEKGIDFVRYSSLPPGNYSFEVKAENQNKIQSKPISIHFAIEAPFWQKWWFYTFLSLITVFMIWFYFRNRLQRVETEKKVMIEKAETDKELILSRLENLRSQMNPHFIFNALNSIQEYILTNEKETASTFLVKFSRLMRIYLEHSKESEVPLEEELKAMRLYLELEKDRFEDTLDYTIIVDKALDTQSLSVPSLFIQPYVENALKHGLLHKKEDRKLEVHFRMNPENDTLICTVTDNGIGRKASAEMHGKKAYLHKSFATSANQKRVELINKTRTKKTSVTIEDLHDSDFVATGTKVTILIPI